MYCKNCGCPIPDGSFICPYCGLQVDYLQQSPIAQYLQPATYEQYNAYQPAPSAAFQNPFDAYAQYNNQYPNPFNSADPYNQYNNPDPYYPYAQQGGYEAYGQPNPYNQYDPYNQYNPYEQQVGQVMPPYAQPQYGANTYQQPLLPAPVETVALVPVQPVVAQPVQPVVAQPVQPVVAQPVQPVVAQPVQPQQMQPVAQPQQQARPQPQPQPRQAQAAEQKVQQSEPVKQENTVVAVEDAHTEEVESKTVQTVQETVKESSGESAPAYSDEENGHATAGFLLSVLSVLLGFIFIINILGFIFSLMGIIRAGKLNGAGRMNAIIGLILSVVSTIVWAFLLVLFLKVLCVI